MAKKAYYCYDVLLGKEIISISRPCNPFSEGFKKGLQQIAETYKVPVTRLRFRRHRDEKINVDAVRASNLAANE